MPRTCPARDMADLTAVDKDTMVMSMGCLGIPLNCPNDVYKKEPK